MPRKEKPQQDSSSVAREWRAYMSLSLGHTDEDVRTMLELEGVSPPAAKTVLGRAKARKDKAIEAAKAPTQTELLHMHHMVLHQALQAGRVDVAQRELTAIGALVSDAPDMTGVTYDHEKPRVTLEQMLAAVARGQRISPAMLAATAKAVAALELGLEPETDKDGKPLAKPQTMEEFQARALALINGASK